MFSTKEVNKVAHLSSCMHGYHVYNVIWSATVVEELMYMHGYHVYNVIWSATVVEELYMHGYHIYNVIWSATVVEELYVKKLGMRRYAIFILQGPDVVGYLPQ